MSCSLFPLFPDLFSLFGGRPTMQATYDIAVILTSYASPALRMLGLGAAKLMFLNTPISSPSDAADFGPFFKAALDIEQVIRWGRIDSGTTKVEDGTLTSALNEAGNPGVSPNTTLSVMEQVYQDYLSGHQLFQTTPTDYSSVKIILNNTVSDAASLLEVGWAKEFLTLHPSSV